jgi:AcrR family transcriptional regulator
MPGQKAPEERRREDILRAAYDVAARRGIEALTLRAVAERAEVSHGTVLFHFERREQLVATLLDRVLYATSVLRVPDSVERLTRPFEKLLELLRVEMERLSAEPRHFRLFLEYWTLGVRHAAIRRRVSAALEAYRGTFREFAVAVVNAQDESATPRRVARDERPNTSPDGLAAVAVSLVHGCALQAVIEPKRFRVEEHFAAAAQLLDHGE